MVCNGFKYVLQSTHDQLAEFNDGMRLRSDAEFLGILEGIFRSMFDLVRMVFSLAFAVVPVGKFLVMFLSMAINGYLRLAERPAGSRSLFLVKTFFVYKTTTLSVTYLMWPMLKLILTIMTKCIVPFSS